MAKKLSPMEQEAKLSVLQGCMDDMDGMMGKGLDSKKKSKIMPKKDEKPAGGDHAMSSESEEAEEEMESEEDSEIEEMSEEELDAKIAELMTKKQKLKA